MLVSQKVFIAMFAWVLVAILVGLASGVEVLVTLILVGLLVTRELTDDILHRSLKRRIDVFILALLVVFAAVVANRIMIVLS